MEVIGGTTVEQNHEPMQWIATPGVTPIAVPTEHGTLLIRLFDESGKKLLVATSEKAVAEPIVRFQSACVFGESFGALDCDCGAQLTDSLRRICLDGGVLTYGWEEGRGTGIENKLQAIALQQAEGISTAEAFERLGHTPEPRDFNNHIAALRSVFDGHTIRLASANPAKISALTKEGFQIVERIALSVPTTPARDAYLAEKQRSLGHLL